MIIGYTFDGVSYPAAPFAQMVDELLDHNEGVIDGINLTNTTSKITIGDGRFIIKGRAFEVKGGEEILVEATQSGELYCVLVAEIDLSKESSDSNFEQVSFKNLSSASNYPSLTQQDINNTQSENGIYQFELARFKNSVNGIKDFEDKRTFLSLDGIFTNANNKTDAIINLIRQELINVKDGSAYFLKATQLTNQDLNSINTEGYYYASGGNTCANKPSDINDFGLYVKRIAGGKYKQILDFNDVTYTRYYSNSIWTPWIKTITKGDFAIITGKVTDNAGIINLPQGFNADNSTIISLLLNPSIKPENWGYGSTMDSASNLSGCFPVRVYLRGENAVITVKDIKIIENQTPTIGTTPDVNFRLVLMKI